MSAAIDRLFQAMCQTGASDLHLCVGAPPTFRKDGRMQAIEPAEPALGVDDVEALLAPIMPPRNLDEF